MDPKDPSIDATQSERNEGSDALESSAAEVPIDGGAFVSVPDVSSDVTVCPVDPEVPRQLVEDGPLRVLPAQEETLQINELSQEDNTSDRSVQKLLPGENSSKLAKQTVIELMGTHTTETDTEGIMPLKCLTFENVIATREEAKPPATCQIVENVREYVKQIENTKEAENYYTEKLVGRTATAMGERQIMEIATEQLAVSTVAQAEENEQQEETTTEDTNPISITDELIGAMALMDGNAMDLHQVEEDNQAITERFKNIMEMFNKFTENLESLEMKTAVKDWPHTRERKRGKPGQDLGDESPRVHRSRYDDYYTQPRSHKKLNVEAPEEDEQPSVSSAIFLDEVNEKVQQSAILRLASTEPKPNVDETFPYSLDNVERKDIATTMSGIVIPSTVEAIRALVTTSPIVAPPPPSMVRVTIACQTSKHQHVSIPPASITAIVESSCDGCTDTEQPHIVNVADATDPPPTLITIEDNPDKESPLKITSSRDSGLTLAKVSPLPSVADLSPAAAAAINQSAIQTNQPSDRTYHTIHIEATSTPSSSVMRRPPLCLRFWSVITDFCAAICLCLQVNKDCIFCLGFFIAFVVSASFLTAFFYRTLSVNPQLYRHSATIGHPQQPHIQYIDSSGLSSSSRDSGFFYF